MCSDPPGLPGKVPACPWVFQAAQKSTQNASLSLFLEPNGFPFGLPRHGGRLHDSLGSSATLPAPITATVERDIWLSWVVRANLGAATFIAIVRGHVPNL